MTRLPRPGYLLPLAFLALATACGSGVDPLELRPLPGILEVSTRDLTIAPDQSRTEFTVSNVGDLPLAVTVTGGALRVMPEGFSLAAGKSVTVVVSVRVPRLSSDVIIEANTGDAAIIDVEVKPLRTEATTDTVVDASVSIAAGSTKTWTIGVPEGAILRVSMVGGDDFDTWLWDVAAKERVEGTAFFNKLRASYEAGPLLAGEYDLKVTTDAWFFNRPVTVFAELRWDRPIAPKD